ncbi:MAG: FGGY family carbohydrate kinase [Spirochaetota bacterium]
MERVISSYILGIDAGTESIRAAVFNERGVCLGFGKGNCSNIHARPGWAEQSIQQWEESIVKAIQAALASSGVRGDDITGIGIDGTSCTIVFLDENKKPLRNAIMWMDVRAFTEAEEIAATKDSALKYVGFGNVSPEWFPCKVLWIKRHEPRVYEQAKTIFEQTDWLAFKLTGEITGNINTTSVRWFYDSSQNGFPKSLYERVGLENIFEKLPDRILPLGEVVGALTQEMAEATGLKKGTPVAAGGADAFVGIIGLNALTPGSLALITGSSQLQLGLMDKELHARGLFGSYPDAVLPGYHTIEAGQISTGSVLKWFKDNFTNSGIEDTAKRKGLDVYQVYSEKAKGIPPGSEGLIVLEHWQGNRTPWVDGSSRGVIRGLTLHHTPYHVFKALMEGVAYGTAVILKIMEEKGVEIKEMIACGGATQSDLWMQINANVTGKTILIPEEQQAVVLGSAILGSVGAGMYGSIKEAAGEMVHIKTRFDPDMVELDAYAFYVDQYIRTYECLKEESRKMVSHLKPY